MIRSEQELISSNADFYYKFPYGIWVPGNNPETIKTLHYYLSVKLLDHHNDILYFDGRRIRTQKDPGSHECYNCGQCIDNGFDVCDNRKCFMDRKKRNLCIKSKYDRIGSWIHKINPELNFQVTKKGIVYNLNWCTNCHKEIKSIGLYRQSQHVEVFGKIQNRIKIVYTKQRIVYGKLRHVVFQRDFYRCLDCGATNKETVLEIDHIIPVSKGGSTTLDNLQTLCKKCNRSKHARTWSGGE